MSQKSGKTHGLALGNLWFAVCLGVLGANPGYGAITACGVGSGAAALLNTYGASAAGNGCASVDVSFENLNAVDTAGGSNTAGFGTSSTSTIGAYVTGATGTVGDTVGSINMRFTPLGTSWTSNVNGNATADYTFSYFSATHSDGSSYTGGSYPAPATTGLRWAFDQLTFSSAPSIGSNNVNATVTYTQTYCLGATTTVGCVAANLATFTVSYVGTAAPSISSTCGASYSCASLTANILSSNTFELVAVSTRVVANRPSSANGTVITLGDFGTDFAQTAEAPEPSTVGLLSAAFLGLGLLARRRRI